MQVILWVVVIGVLLAIEAMTVDLVSIWFALGSFGGLIVACFTDDWLLQIIIALAVSAVSFIFLRPLAKRKFFSKQEATNADRAVGQTGKVLEETTAAAGLVKVLGSDWSARTEGDGRIPVGATVQVIRIEGVKVIVAPVDAPEGTL